MPSCAGKVCCCALRTATLFDNSSFSQRSTFRPSFAGCVSTQTNSSLNVLLTASVDTGMRFDLICCLGTIAAFLPVHAQTVASTSLVNAGTSYGLNIPSQAAAPGQILVLSLFGIKASFPQPLMGIASNNGFPTSLGGITVDLVQDNPPSVNPTELRGIQQAFCEKPDICTTVTGITIQVPFTLSNTFANAPRLRVSENGQVVGTVLIRSVTDNVHVLNTCDYTLISISAADSVPKDVCAPVALSHNKLNSLYNLARSGDGVAVYAYGLGARANEGYGIDSQLVQSYQLSFDFRLNASGSRITAGFGTIATPLFIGYAGGGTYQVNFSIPQVPVGLPACDGAAIKSNLTVTISGPNSFDAVPLCVTP